MTRVAFIGLGHMGLPMAARLVGAGHEVRGFDSSADARGRLGSNGGDPAEDASKAASGSEVVILMLPTSDVVERVVNEPAFRAAAAGATLVDMGSSEPQRTRTLAIEMSRSSIEMIDAPVSGGVARATDGSLAIMAGGRSQTIAALSSVFAPLGRLTYCGPVGSGHAVKALNNLLSASHLLLLCEALEAGREFGLDPHVMVDVFNSSSGRSGSTETKWPRFIEPASFDSGFGLGLMLKDVMTAQGLFNGVGRASPTVDVTVDAWQKAAAALAAGADHTEIVTWVQSRT